RAGIASVTVLNRTRENAERLVASLTEQGIAAHSAPVADLAAATAAADVVVCCTGAQDTVLTPDDVGARDGVALTVCDLGLPRDVDPSVAGLADVSLVDLETVRNRTDTDAGGPVSSEKQITQASGIILDEVREYLAAQRSAEVTPTVTALRKQAAEVVDSELLRLGRKLPDLDPTVRAELDRTVHRVADKLLHAPTVRVKELASRDGGAAGVDYADALRELFGLDPQAPAAVAKPSTRGAGDTGAGDSGAGDTRGESGDGNNTQPSSRQWDLDMTRTIRIGTRASKLATAQTGLVARTLEEAGQSVEIVPVSTPGDRSSAPISEIGVGVFTSALREALTSGEVDVAVHSYKDLPTAPVPGITLAAVPERADPRDVLIATGNRSLGELPPGSRLGTGSPRRAAQLRALGLGHELVAIRGNLD